MPLLMSLDINIDIHTNQRNSIPNSIAMLRLPILTSQFSKTLSFTSFTVHNTLRAGLKLQTLQHSPRRLANMSTQSKACCTVPPVVSEGYKEKGEWITINGMKTYATGPKEAKSALLVVYDIFGTSIAGADILVHSDKDHQVSSRRHCRAPTFLHTLTRITSIKCSCLVSFVFQNTFAIEKGQS
jgi:hypothetical protein